MYQCQIHKKDFQAFCFEEKSLLCIDCLLISKEHFSHEVSTLEIAAKLIRTSIADNLERLRTLESQYPSIASKTSAFQKCIFALQSSVISSVNALRMELERQTEKRFENVLSQVNSVFESQLSYLNSLESKNEGVFRQATKMIEKMSEQLEETETDLKLICSFASKNVKDSVEDARENLCFSLEEQLEDSTLELQLVRLRSEISGLVCNELAELQTANVSSFKACILALNEQQSVPEFELPERLSDFLFPGKTTKIDFAKNLTDENANCSPEQTNSQSLSRLFKIEEFQRNESRGSPDRIFFESMRNVSNKETVVINPHPKKKEIERKSRGSASLKVIDRKTLSSTPNLFYKNSLKSETGEQLYLISGGSKSASFYLRIFDCKENAIVRCKMSIDCYEKNGVFANRDGVFLFGGKLKGKATNSIFSCNLDKGSVDILPDFKLNSKKFDFGYLEVNESTLLLFGGRNERNAKFEEIELVDFQRREAKVIGKLCQPASNMSVLKLTSEQAKFFGLQKRALKYKRQLSNKSKTSNEGKIKPPSVEKNELSVNFELTLFEDPIEKHSEQFVYSFEDEFSRRSLSPCMSGGNILIKDFSEKFSKNTDNSLNMKNEKEFLLKSHDNFFLIIGGEDQSGKILKTVDCFVLGSETCFSFSDLNDARKDAWAFTHGTSIWVIGGEGIKSKLKTIEKIEASVCSKAGNLSTERCGFKGIVSGKKVMLLGGKGNKGVLNSVEYLTVSSDGLKVVKRTQGFEHLAFFELCKFRF